MDVAAIRGFNASPDFYDLFHLMAVRSSVVGVVIKETAHISRMPVEADPHSGRPTRWSSSCPQVPGVRCGWDNRDRDDRRRQQD